MSVTLAVRMPDELKAPLELIAEHYRRSKNFLAVDAIRSYIEEKLEEIAEEKGAQEAVRRLNDPNRVLISSEEMTDFINNNCHE